MQSTRRCSRCGTPLFENQTFCAQCGSPANAAEGEALTQTPSNFTAPPPPEGARPEQPGGYFAPPPTYTPANQMQQGYGFVQPPPANNRVKRRGCAVPLIVLTLFVLLGGVAYGGYRLLGGNTTNPTGSPGSGPGQIQKSGESLTPISSLTTSGSTSSTPGSAPSTGATLPVNLSFVFSTVDLTITDMQQAKSFEDDPGLRDAGSIIRVNLKEANNSLSVVRYMYGSEAFLVLPDQSVVALGGSKFNAPPQKGATQNNWLDFAVPAGTTTDGLIFRLGNNQTAQIDIPLKSEADLSAYESKTVAVNKSATSGRATWTVTEATLSWSGAGKQAEKGTRFIIVQLGVTVTENVNYGLNWNLRMKAGDSTSTPDFDGSDTPQTLAAGESANGYATFPVPEGVNSFSFVLMGDDTTPTTSVDFEI